eukprot:393824-Rhodomonas_salina.1
MSGTETGHVVSSTVDSRACSPPVALPSYPRPETAANDFPGANGVLRLRVTRKSQLSRVILGTHQPLGGISAGRRTASTLIPGWEAI